MKFKILLAIFLIPICLSAFWARSPQRSNPNDPKKTVPGVVWTPVPTPTATFVPLTSSKILFVSARDGNNEIYVMEPSGASQTRLTNDAGADYSPRWSPDRSKIVFTRENQIYVMDANGANQTRLTNNIYMDAWPKWSPDGSKIAFMSTRNGNWEIFVMNIDGSSQMNVSGASVPVVPGMVPDWAPSNRIVFRKDLNGLDNSQVEIFSVEGNGANLTRLITNTSWDGTPVWSPNGTKIAFLSYRDGNYQIYSMDANGANQTRLTYSTGAFDQTDGHCWSPDGSRICFFSNRDSGSGQIYVMDADGTDQFRLTFNTAAEVMPKWAPDGSKIAFYTDRNGNDEIYIMDPNGANQTRLTVNTALDQIWDWR